jgi:soluble cytochrome b562
MKDFKKYLEIIQEMEENKTPDQKFDPGKYLSDNIKNIKKRYGYEYENKNIQNFDHANFKDKLKEMKNFFTNENNWRDLKGMKQIVFTVTHANKIKIFELKSYKIPNDADMWEYKIWNTLHVQTIDKDNFEKDLNDITPMSITPRDGGSPREGWSFLQLLVEMSSSY